MGRREARGVAVTRRDMLAGAFADGIASLAPGPASAARRDLTGLWTNATYTPLERPAELPRLVLTPREAEAFEAPRRALGGRPPSAAGQVGQSESEFIEMGSGLMRIGSQVRASIIVDPPDGRLPLSPAGRARLAAMDAGGRLDHPEERPAFERCLASSGSGAPLVPAMDANVTAIIQTAEAVVILSERLGEARVVRVGASLPARPVPSWTGESVGRWRGSALEVETAGLRPGLTDRFFFHLSGSSRVVERFERTGPDEVHYRFTVEDPELYARPWSGEVVFRPAPALFEYACHEGNYGLRNILGGARLQPPDHRPRAP